MSFGLIALGVGISLYSFGITTYSGFSSLTVLAIILATIGMLLHGMYRAISLSVKPIHIFNLISIMPAIFALLIYFFWRSSDHQILVLVLVFAGAISAFLAAFILREYLFSKEKMEASLLKLKQSAKYGFWSFIPGAALSLVTAATFTLLRQGGDSDATAGYF